MQFCSYIMSSKYFHKFLACGPHPLPPPAPGQNIFPDLIVLCSAREDVMGFYILQYTTPFLR